MSWSFTAVREMMGIYLNCQGEVLLVRKTAYYYLHVWRNTSVHYHDSGMIFMMVHFWNVCC